MPLLNGKPLSVDNSKKFHDDEEVFYCERTNEIFDDYQEYCDRVISCSCMIWTCAITGKSDLTYEEALESEERALRNIKDLPPELRNPVLYLASLTTHKHFSALADDVFNFLKSRYCIGEGVEVTYEYDEWSYCQVTRVIMPTPEEVIAYCEKNNIPHPVEHRPYPAELYKYEVEEYLENYDCDDSDSSGVEELRTFLVNSKSIRRPKGLYTKDKNRAYLKQFTEMKKNNIWVVKSAILDKYNINNIKFSDIFVGEPPDFTVHVSLTPKAPIKSGKMMQGSIKNFLVAGEKGHFKRSPDKKGKHSVSKEVALKVKKKYAATIDKVAAVSRKEDEKKQKRELLLKKKEEIRQEKEKLADFAKEWQKKREDLECEDLKELPLPCPVDCKISNHLFGDFVMILEFLSCFKTVLHVNDYFPYKLHFSLLERALLENEPAGPFSDLLQMLLNAIFEFQDQEDDEVRKLAPRDISLFGPDELSVTEAINLATQAARWSRTYQSVPLNELHMDAITVTDILRLHILASGGRSGELSAKWRYQERGGYTSSDDPGLDFRLNEPHILKYIAYNCASGLPIEDKLKILNCLMNQIITYASVRDVIDERYEAVATGRRQLRNDQIVDTKKDKERIKQRMERTKENGESFRYTKEEREKLEEDANKKKQEYNKRFLQLQEAAMEFQLAPLGTDRGHRRFWIFSSIPGLFVEDDERWPGNCLPQPTLTTKAAPVSGDEDDTMSYIRKLFDEGRVGSGSDKENEGDANPLIGSPKRKLFGENGMCSTSPPQSMNNSPVKAEEVRSLVCTSDPDTCTVHNPDIQRTKWLFYYKEEELNDLIKTLNKRGYREHALRESLVVEKERVLQHLAKCPVSKLNRFAPVIIEPVVNKTIGTRSKKGYKNSYLNCAEGTPVDEVIEMYLRETILDTELKIHEGALGKLKVDDRFLWRDCISKRSYGSQDPHLTWPTKMAAIKEVVKEESDDEEVPSRPGSSLSIHSSNDSCEEIVVPDQSTAVRDLAMAVLQLGRSVEQKFRKKPLLFQEKVGSRLTALERWELSLMRCTSFSQIYLHLMSLENSIQWNKSVLNARCKICRRGKDDVNMLLCDGCDGGFHLYCLKPKLNSIPPGEWLCPRCKPKEKPPVDRNRRRRFLDEEEDQDNLPLSKRRKNDDSLDERRSKRSRN